MSSLSPVLYFRPQDWPKHVHDLATIAPMISGVLAPLAVLYDIPALSEKWYTKDGVPQPDFKASLVLSAISLVATIIANALLVIRFSLTAHRWRVATRISVIFWAIKVGVSLANVILFGDMRRQGGSYQYAEGFWSAVLSVILGGIVFLLLLLHWAIELRVRGDVRTKLQQNVRVTGRHFMLQTTLYVATVALTAIVFCFIEGWSYLDSVYFSIVTMLTVGFGDFEPTKTSTRIVLFPLALLGIAQLGSILSLIVAFFSSRAAQRKAQSRALHERERQIEQDKKEDKPDLMVEIEFLVKLNSKQDMKDQMSELAFSVLGFFVFWMVGAAIFMGTEGWSYPTAMYFCYIFFLSIGYGDFSPVSPAGKVVFIIYALLAVPIMAAFAVTAIQGLVTQVSEWRLAKRKVHEGIKNAGAEDSADVVPHAEYVERYHRRWASSQERSNSSQPESQQEIKEGEQQERRQHDVDLKEEESELTLQLIEHAIDLERHARRLLETHLPNGSKGQIVLKADRNVQLRHMQLMRKRDQKQEDIKRIQSSGTDSATVIDDDNDQEGEDPQASDGTKSPRGRKQQRTKQEGTEDKMVRLQAEPVDNGDDDPDWISHPLDDDGTMEEIRRYRQAFAAFLATGSRLRRLEGVEKYKAERRLMSADDEIEVDEVPTPGEKGAGETAGEAPSKEASPKQRDLDTEKQMEQNEEPKSTKGNRPPDQELGDQKDYDETL